jgi:hypothetical protein
MSGYLLGFGVLAGLIVCPLVPQLGEVALACGVLAWLGMELGL